MHSKVKLGQLQKEEKRLQGLIKVAKPHLLPELPPMPVMECKEETEVEESKPDAQVIPEDKKHVKTSGSPPENKKLKIEDNASQPEAVTAENKESKKKEQEAKVVSPSKPSNETTATSQASDESPKTKASNSQPAKQSVYVLEGQDEHEEKGGLIVRKKKTKALEKPKVSAILCHSLTNANNVYFLT